MGLWQENAASPIHSLHFGFGLGALIAPQVVQPFLSSNTDDDVDADVTTTMYPTQTWISNTTEIRVESRIEIPYTIMAIFIFGFSVVVFGLYLKGPPHGFPVRVPTKNFKKMVHPATCGHGSSGYGVALLAGIFFYYVHILGRERAIGKYLFSYAVDGEVQFTNREASNLLTAFWASFTCGRMLAIPISKFVAPKYMILGDALLNISIATVMALVAYNNGLALWITSCLCGACLAVGYPNGLAWANVYLDVNSMAVMVACLGSSCGDFAYNYATGFLFEKDPRNLMYVMIFGSSAMLATFVVMQCLAHFLGRHISSDESQECDDHVDIAFTLSKKELLCDLPDYLGRYRKLSI